MCMSVSLCVSVTQKDRKAGRIRGRETLRVNRCVQVSVSQTDTQDEKERERASAGEDGVEETDGRLSVKKHKKGEPDRKSDSKLESLTGSLVVCRTVEFAAEPPEQSASARMSKQRCVPLCIYTSHFQISVPSLDHLCKPNNHHHLICYAAKS